MTTNLRSMPTGEDGPEARFLVVEVPAGSHPDTCLRTWLEQLDAWNASRFLLSCDTDRGGLWAGLNQWLLELFPRLEQHAPELVQRHSHELVTVVPALRRKIRSTTTTLTDEAPADETVRNYAIDRGYRIGHGLIDLIDGLSEVTGDRGLVVACTDFDRAGALVKRFFRELMRRRGRQRRVTLVVTVAAGRGEATRRELESSVPGRIVQWELPVTPSPAPDPAVLRERALELEDRVQSDPLEVEIRLPELIRLWSASDRPERALSWKAFALGLYNHYGFYEDAYPYVEPVLANLEVISPIQGYEFFFTRWNLVGSLFGCLVANGEPDRAFQVVRQEALEKITEDEERTRIHYVMAMLYGRFLPEADLDLAEQHLSEGLAILSKTGAIAERDRVFLTVFLNNGLAYVRHRQGRPHHAIELCQTGFNQMNEHWKPGEHKLHRSVLLYNQAQVYSALGLHDQAVELFGRALEMDPNYSEYYNERGNVFLAMGRHEEAVRDYHDAIRTSPPYPEVWTNLGQCYRRMGRGEEAAEALSRALDLDPDLRLARVARAQVLDELGRSEEAEQDYSRALALDPADALLWANRAVLRFQRGACEDSLADLDQAIRIAPENVQLYQNRAVALESLGREDDVRRDLETYLRLAPDAPDRSEVEARLRGIAGLASA